MEEILNAITVPVMVIDKDFNIVFANRTMLALYGPADSNVAGKKCHVYSHKSSVPCNGSAGICPHKEVFSLKNITQTIHTHTLSDGSQKIVEITASPIKDSNGNVMQMIEILRDITKEKKTESLHKESEEMFEALAERSLVGIYLIQDKVFKYVNPQMSKLFGYAPEELIEKKGPFDLTHPDDRGLVMENIRKRISGEVKSINYGFRCVKKNGEVFNVEVYGSHTFYRGKPAVIGTIIDITERHKFEVELRNRIKELEEFYDMAVGRELQMVQLKDEITRLKEELKRYRK
ncbi:MAG: PAS domain S-box protein [Nitrospirae bacterium]|nr:PAS domain S-box protein [Nitrospirota bacterium]